MLTPTNSFLFLGVLTFVPILVKIDKKYDRRVLTEGYTLHSDRRKRIL